MKRKGIIGVLSVATLALAGLALLPSTPTFAATTSSSNVTVRLTVLPSGESVVIRFPSDGDTFATDKITIKKDYTSARTLETKIIYTDENGITTTYNVPVENVADPHGNPTNGTSESELDITAITGGRYGDYKIITTVNGLPSTEDVLTSLTVQLRSLIMVPIHRPIIQKSILSMVHASIILQFKFTMKTVIQCSQTQLPFQPQIQQVATAA